jgi:hypothetical protein
MKPSARRSLRVLLIGACAALGLVTPASADFLLECDNGRSYPIYARAVSVAGDLVTGHLVLGPRRRVHIRLVPMGVGYRYIARGLWLDGWRGNAVLHFGRHASTACTVLPGPPVARSLA